MVFRIAASLACIVISFSTVAQTTSVHVHTPRRQSLIEKTGVASREVTPDDITITIAIWDYAEDKEKAVPLQVQETQIKEKLRDAGIDLKKLTLNRSDDVFVEEKHFLHSKKVPVKQKSLQLKVSKAEEVQKVFAMADELKLRYTEINKAEYSGKDSLIKELRIAAVKDAKEQASSLMTAAGDTVGQTTYIHDNVTHHCRIRTRDEARADTTFTDVADRYFSKVKYTVKAHMKFEIK